MKIGRNKNCHKNHRGEEILGEITLNKAKTRKAMILINSFDLRKRREQMMNNITRKPKEKEMGRAMKIEKICEKTIYYDPAKFAGWPANEGIWL